MLFSNAEIVKSPAFSEYSIRLINILFLKVFFKDLFENKSVFFAFF
jgi:hypothetical protein